LQAASSVPRSAPQAPEPGRGVDAELSTRSGLGRGHPLHPQRERSCRGAEPSADAASPPRAADREASRQAAARLPVPPAPNPAARRTVWPRAWDFWPSRSLAERPYTPKARPCRELDAVGMQHAPGTQAGVPSCGHARRDRSAPGAASYVPCPPPPESHHEGWRRGPGRPAACPACPRGQSLGGRGAVGRFPPHALHPWGLACKERAPFLLPHPFFFPPLPSSKAQTLLVVVVGIYGPVYLISGEPILISEAAREGLHWTAR